MQQPASAHATHVGCVRECNEDCALSAPELGLWLVADGMGGHASGEVASRLVAEHVRQGVAHGLGLVNALEAAHMAVLDAAARGVGGQGMGATAVALRLEAGDYEISWVGDSRAYLWNGRRLSQLTRDHTFVQQLVDGGALTPTQALSHPQRNQVTQALGAAGLQELDVGTVLGTLRPGQALLLCSDGLTGEVPDQRIRDVLAAEGDEQTKVDRLIDLALDAGAPDNVTVVLVSIPGA